MRRLGGRRWVSGKPRARYANALRICLPRSRQFAERLLIISHAATQEFVYYPSYDTTPPPAMGRNEDIGRIELYRRYQDVLVGGDGGWKLDILDTKAEEIAIRVRRNEFVIKAREARASKRRQQAASTAAVVKEAAPASGEVQDEEV